MFLLEIFGWSSVPFVAFCDLFGLCSPVGFLARELLFLVSRVSAPRVWGFLVVSLVFSFRAPLLPFLPSRGLLQCLGTLSVLCLAPFCRVFGGFVCLLCAVLFFLLSRFHGYLARPASVSPRHRSLFLSPRDPFRSLSRPFFALPRSVFLCCLVFLFGSFFLFCALASGPPGMSAVVASSTFARTASLSSIVAAASSSFFWFSPLAIFLLCCSPLGVVSLGSCGTGSCCFVILPVLIFTPWLSFLLQLGVSTLRRGGCSLFVVSSLFLRRRIPRVAF